MTTTRSEILRKYVGKSLGDLREELRKREDLIFDGTADTEDVAVATVLARMINDRTPQAR
jgi:hypothetical protein